MPDPIRYEPQELYELCQCGCGCENDGDWHYTEPIGCRCVSLGCDCVKDAPRVGILEAAE